MLEKSGKLERRSVDIIEANDALLKSYIRSKVLKGHPLSQLCYCGGVFLIHTFSFINALKIPQKLDLRLKEHAALSLYPFPDRLYESIDVRGRGMVVIDDKAAVLLAHHGSSYAKAA